MIKYVIILMLNFIVLDVDAKDFGIEGHTYEIAEEDILQYIKKKLANFDIQKLNNEMKSRTTQYVERPNAVQGITNAKENALFYYDPTYTLQRDIKDHEGKLIHKAGTKINPLEHLSLQEDLIFINGDIKSQIEFALKHREKKLSKAKIILTKGSPLSLQREHKIWIYFDQAGAITDKLGISEVPAIVEQEGLKLRITIVGGQQ